MSFQQGAFQSNAFQMTAASSVTPAGVGNTIYGGLWSVGGNTVIGRALCVLFSLAVYGASGDIIRIVANHEL